MSNQVELLTQVTMVRPERAQIVVVGAGGTGARVCLLLPRLVREGDSILIIDPDTVEERNCKRQHFIREDVGQAKATLALMRTQAAVPEGVRVQAVVGEATRYHLLTPYNATGIPSIFLGCVDSNAARQLIYSTISIGYGIPSLYIDAGNTLRSGQVVWSASAWPISGVKVKGKAVALPRPGFTCQFDGIRELYPALLQPEQVVEQSCAARVDEQSVIANNDAASIMAKLLAMVLYGLPVSWGAQNFSTLGGTSVVPLTTAEVGRYSVRLSCQ